MTDLAGSIPVSRNSTILTGSLLRVDLPWVLAYRPTQVKWHLMIASCHRKSGNYPQALETYKHIHKKFPDNIECLKVTINLLPYSTVRKARFSNKYFRVRLLLTRVVKMLRPHPKHTKFEHRDFLAVPNPPFINHGLLAKKYGASAYLLEVARLWHNVTYYCAIWFLINQAGFCCFLCRMSSPTPTSQTSFTYQKYQ